MDKNLSLNTRLERIIETSYDIICGKIGSGRIIINNEASFQLHFGVVLQQVGQLYEYSPADKFTIKLEDIQTLIQATTKSSGNARCDIMLSLSDGNNTSTAAIELKCFKRNGNNPPVTNNRKSIHNDIENLEQYRQSDFCYEILYTNDSNYPNPNSTSNIPLGDGQTIDNSVNHNIKGRYILQWDEYNNTNHYFLKIKVK